MKLALALSSLVVASTLGSSSAKGIRGPEIEARIVGGTSTSFSKYPFFVDLNGCGASLIWEDVVLTAAHCNGGIASANLGPNQESVQVTSGTTHPNYDPQSNNFDLMVLKLSNTVSGATTIGLETDNGSPGDGDELTVIGLGLTSEDGRPSDGLREVNVNHIPVSQCNSLYDGGITDAMLCAGVEGGGKDSCQGKWLWLVVFYRVEDT